MDALKAERVKTKYSPDYHVKTLTLIKNQMPCTEPHQISMKVEVVILLVGTLFQTAKSSTFLSRDDWCSVCDHVRSLLELSQTPEFLANLKEAHVEEPPKEESEESDDEGKDAAEVMELLEKQNAFEIERSVFPSLSTFLERMDENLWKSYQKLAARSSSLPYLERINDENKLLFLIDETLELLSQFDLDVFKARISLIKLTYLYYKNDAIYEKIQKRLEAKNSEAATAQLKTIYFVKNSDAEI